MSDEESFVILGSSPTPSMEAYTSIGSQSKNSVRNVLENDCSQEIKTSMKLSPQSCNSYISEKENGKENSVKHSLKSINEAMTASEGSFSLLTPSIKPTTNDTNCAAALIITDKMTSSPIPIRNPTPLGSMNASPKLGNSLPTNLATQFLLGEMNSQSLKENVFTQFPSLCTPDPSSGDIIKLQSFITEYEHLKDNLRTSNAAMRQHFVLIQKWQNEVKYYKEEQRVIMAKLRNENIELRNELEMKNQLMKLNDELAMREKADLVQSMSEKVSIINNLSAHIDKLDHQQNMSYEFVKNSNKTPDTENEHEYVLTTEHKRELKEIERKLSEVTAENLEFQDMKKIYVDEIDCLKVNLVSAEELLKKAQADINILKSKDVEKSELFEKYEKEKDDMKQEMELLKAQLEVYRTDFEMERASRQNIAGEKEQLINDIKMLQRRNQQLIEENERARNELSASTSGRRLTLSSRNPSREGRDDSHQSNQFICPICSVRFMDLTSLEYHIQTCLDKA